MSSFLERRAMFKAYKNILKVGYDRIINPTQTPHFVEKRMI